MRKLYVTERSAGKLTILIVFAAILLTGGASSGIRAALAAEEGKTRGN